MKLISEWYLEETRYLMICAYINGIAFMGFCAYMFPGVVPFCAIATGIITCFNISSFSKAMKKLDQAITDEELCSEDEPSNPSNPII